MRNRLLSILIVFYSGIACSEPSREDIDELVMDRISKEYIACAAFYGTMSIGFTKSVNKDAAEQYKLSMNRAFNFALETSKKGRSEKIAEKVTSARTTLALDEMRLAIESDFSNASILVNKYRDRCTWVMDNSKEFSAEKTNAVYSKYGLTIQE